MILTSLEKTAACDGLAVLRPRLPPVSTVSAILRAFGYVGRPYDFDFDFSTDSALVCSELVLKAYEPKQGVEGFTLPLLEFAGHRFTPPNEFARICDEEWDRPHRRFDLVLFLDGDERRGKAVEADGPSFRASWRRPKWHVLATLSARPGGAPPVSLPQRAEGRPTGRPLDSDPRYFLQRREATSEATSSES